MPLNVSLPPAIGYSGCYSLAIDHLLYKCKDLFPCMSIPYLSHLKQEMVNSSSSIERYGWGPDLAPCITFPLTLLKKVLQGTLYNSAAHRMGSPLSTAFSTFCMLTLSRALYAPPAKRNLSALKGGFDDDDVSLMIHFDSGSSFGCWCMCIRILQSTVVQVSAQEL